MRVTDALNGLRFDIYERVTLPENAAAVEELEEIELVPRVQTINDGDQTLLKGHLLLIGVYRSSDQRSQPMRLEQQLPVEISLPSERLQQGEHLTLEIENFDVHLLSPRTINVTGVLALRGVQPVSGPSPVWRDDSFTVVHQASLEPAFRTEASTDGETADAPGEIGDVAGGVSGDGAGHAPGETTGDAPIDREAAQDALNGPDAGIPEVLAASGSPGTSADEGHNRTEPAESEVSAASADGGVPNPDAASPQPDPFATFPTIPADTKAHNRDEAGVELKVAFGAKPETAQDAASGAGLSQMLRDKWLQEEPAQDQPQEPQVNSRPEEPQTPNSRTSSGDELEWSKLFVSGDKELESFRKIRLCIVQREDSLESIAARYQLRPIEIQQRNRLSGDALSEGQVLYIP